MCDTLGRLAQDSNKTNKLVHSEWTQSFLSGVKDHLFHFGPKIPHHLI